MQYYDCLFLDEIWYCRRPTNSSTLQDSVSSVCPTMNRKSFLELSTQNISAQDLLLYCQKKYENDFICNCSHENLGSNCQYQLSEPMTTPVDLLPNQLSNAVYVSFYDQWCLIDIKCNMGTSCLDWRYICDGIEHCQFGEDEFNCELLEVNQCDSNEYRCRNGMCIPQEWFFDCVRLSK